jgi:hypothetical protein
MAGRIRGLAWSCSARDYARLRSRVSRTRRTSSRKSFVVSASSARSPVPNFGEDTPPSCSELRVPMSGDVAREELCRSLAARRESRGHRDDRSRRTVAVEPRPGRALPTPIAIGAVSDASASDAGALGGDRLDRRSAPANGGRFSRLQLPAAVGRRPAWSARTERDPGPSMLISPSFSCDSPEALDWLGKANALSGGLRPQAAVGHPTYRANRWP